MRWVAALLGRLRRQPDGGELDAAALQQLEAGLGYHFQSADLLVTALKHRSYVYAHQGHGIESNERLEYLGDAVLDLLVADFLFHRYGDKREGDLTQMKSLVVSRPVLARKARSLGVDRYILLSPEERAAGGGRQPSILCDALEAIIGAVYLDGGLEASRTLVARHVLGDFDELILRDDYANYKSRLLEHVQSLGNGHPRYTVHAEEGPDHCKVFSVEVCITGESIGRGQGRSKKEAQQMAARDALHRLGAL
ncbi:MAG: ribonuclease III [Candidatus Latescibacterota bacterium]